MRLSRLRAMQPVPTPCTYMPLRGKAAGDGVGGSWAFAPESESSKDTETPPSKLEVQVFFPELSRRWGLTIGYGEIKRIHFVYVSAQEGRYMLVLFHFLLIFLLLLIA